MTAVAGVRRVATYERVSSEDQRDRETIKTQTDEIARHLVGQPGVELVSRYVDDGVSGTIPLADRPDGRRLLADAAAHRFEELWLYKVDRLGRDAVDLLVVRRRLDALGIALVSVVEDLEADGERTRDRGAGYLAHSIRPAPPAPNGDYLVHPCSDHRGGALSGRCPECTARASLRVVLLVAGSGYWRAIDHAAVGAAGLRLGQPRPCRAERCGRPGSGPGGQPSWCCAS